MTAKTTAIFQKTEGGCYMTLDGTRLDFDSDVSVQITSGGNVVALNIEGSIYHVQLTASITVNGAAFTGTAAQLRDKLAGEVFSSGTYSGPFQSLRADLDNGLSTTLLVLGDSTGDGYSEWVGLFADKLGDKYPVHVIRYQIWNDAAQDYTPTYYRQGAATDVYGLLPGTAHALELPTADVPHFIDDVDLRVHIRAGDYSSGADQVLLSKYGNPGNRAIWLALNSTGVPYLAWTADGSTAIQKFATANLASQPNDSDIWLRATLDVDNGAGGNTVTFYTSSDGQTWTQLGNTVVTTGTTSVFNATAAWNVGRVSTGFFYFTGRIYHVEIRHGIGGKIVSPPSIYDWRRTGDTVTGGAPLLNVFNGSKGGAAITYLNDATRVPLMVPQLVQGAVIFSCSHNDTNRHGYSYLADWNLLLSRVKERVAGGDFIVTTQNPRISPATNILEHSIRRGQLMGWARRNGLGVVDAYGAFPTDMAPYLSADGIHPIAAGNELWATTVYNAFNN